MRDLVEGEGLDEDVVDELGMPRELFAKGVGVIMQEHTCGLTRGDVLATRILLGVRAEEEQELEVLLQWLDKKNPTMA